MCRTLPLCPDKSPLCDGLCNLRKRKCSCSLRRPKVEFVRPATTRNKGFTVNILLPDVNNPDAHEVQTITCSVFEWLVGALWSLGQSYQAKLVLNKNFENQKSKFFLKVQLVVKVVASKTLDHQSIVPFEIPDTGGTSYCVVRIFGLIIEKQHKN